MQSVNVNGIEQRLCARGRVAQSRCEPRPAQVLGRLERGGVPRVIARAAPAP
jgi:hypothetical protein